MNYNRCFQFDFNAAGNQHTEVCFIQIQQSEKSSMKKRVIQNRKHKFYKNKTKYTLKKNTQLKHLIKIKNPVIKYVTDWEPH